MNLDDRRVKKTRHQIKEALVACLNNKPIEKITSLNFALVQKSIVLPFTIIIRVSKKSMKA